MFIKQDEKPHFKSGYFSCFFIWRTYDNKAK